MCIHSFIQNKNLSNILFGVFIDNFYVFSLSTKVVIFSKHGHHMLY